MPDLARRFSDWAKGLFYLGGCLLVTAFLLVTFLCVTFYVLSPPLPPPSATG